MPLVLLLTRTYFINAWTSRRRQDLLNEILQTQPNQQFPTVTVAETLWLLGHKTIYEITSTHYALLTFFSHFSTHFHSCIKPVTLSRGAPCPILPDPFSAFAIRSLVSVTLPTH